MESREEWLAFYAERGLATLPLRPRDKRPLRRGWQTPSPQAWDHAPPDANIGILCGAASGGLVVLDFDTLDGPRYILGMKPEELAVHTTVVRTARGWHAYTRSTGVRTHSPCRGLDVRSEGSLVVASPSVHPSGAAYELIHPAAPIAALSTLPPFMSREPLHRATRIDWARAEAWIALQSPKLQASWRNLRTPTGSFDRSAADFAVARCLSEAGFDSDAIAELLAELPGSKAKERGRNYGLRTAIRAASAPRRAP